MSLKGRLKGRLISFSETEEKWWLQWGGELEGEIMPVDSIFLVRREAVSTAVSERCRAEPLRSLEKVWN